MNLRSLRISNDSPLSAMILMAPFSTSPSASPSAPSRSSAPAPVSVAVTSSTVTARDRASVVRCTIVACLARADSSFRSTVAWASSAVASRTMPTIRRGVPSGSRRILPCVWVHWSVPSRRCTVKYEPYVSAPPSRAVRTASASRAPSSDRIRSPSRSGVSSNSSDPRSKTTWAASSSDRVPASRSHSKLPMLFSASRSPGPVTESWRPRPAPCPVPCPDLSRSAAATRHTT